MLCNIFFPFLSKGGGRGESNSYLIVCVCVLKGIFILFYFSRILNFVYKMCVSVCGAQFTACPSLPSPAKNFILVKREQEGIRTFCLDSVCFFSSAA